MSRKGALTVVGCYGSRRMVPHPSPLERGPFKSDHHLSLSPLASRFGPRRGLVETLTSVQHQNETRSDYVDKVPFSQTDHFKFQESGVPFLRCPDLRKTLESCEGSL